MEDVKFACMSSTVVKKTSEGSSEQKLASATRTFLSVQTFQQKRIGATMFMTLAAFYSFLNLALFLTQKISNYMEDDTRLDPDLQSLKMDLTDLTEKLDLLFSSKDELVKSKMKDQIVEEMALLIVRFNEKKTQKRPVTGQIGLIL